MDKRTIVIGIIGTYTLLAIIDGSGYFLSTARFQPLIDIPFAFLFGLAIFAQFFIMPGVLTRLATRNPFLWGAFPYTLILLFDGLRAVVRPGHVMLDNTPIRIAVA